VSSDACPGLRTGTGMYPKLGAYGSGGHGLPKLRTSIAFDLRQEPGAAKPHAGICAWGRGTPVPYRDRSRCPAVTRCSRSERGPSTATITS